MKIGDLSAEQLRDFIAWMESHEAVKTFFPILADRENTIFEDWLQKREPEEVCRGRIGELRKVASMHDYALDLLREKVREEEAKMGDLGTRTNS